VDADKEIIRLKHQRDGLQQTVFDLQDKVIERNETIVQLRDYISDLAREYGVKNEMP
jgi:hypothetical protein